MRRAVAGAALQINGSKLFRSNWAPLALRGRGGHKRAERELAPLTNLTVVLDASVILNGLLADPPREPDTEKALALIGWPSFAATGNSATRAIWVDRGAGRAARLTPQTAVEDFEFADAMQFR